MIAYAYYNGIFDKKDNIQIPLSDRSIFFGDAVYDAMIGSYDRILWEEEHIERLLTNASKIGIKHKFSKNKLSSLFREIGVRSRLSSYFLYCQISRNLAARNHSANNCTSNLLITIDPIEIKEINKPLKLITVPDKRYEMCDIKTVNLLPAVLSATIAENTGADEAVFVKDEYVTECTKSNISILKQGRLITHPKSSRILPGIAREHLIKICQSENISIDERPFTINEMINADDILVTSTTKLCRKVSHINNQSVGNDTSSANLLCKIMYKEYLNVLLTNKYE